MLEARNFRPIVRPGAGRNQDRFRAHARASRQTHGVGVFEHGATLYQGDIEALERTGVGGFKTRDFAILVGDQCRPMKCPALATVQP